MDSGEFSELAARVERYGRGECTDVIVFASGNVDEHAVSNYGVRMRLSMVLASAPTWIPRLIGLIWTVRELQEYAGQPVVSFQRGR